MQSMYHTFAIAVLFLVRWVLLLLWESATRNFLLFRLTCYTA